MSRRTIVADVRRRAERVLDGSQTGLYTKRLMARDLVALADQVGSALLVIRAADRLANAVDGRIKLGHLDARSEVGDALLDYGSLDDHRDVLGIDPTSPSTTDRPSVAPAGEPKKGPVT